MSFIRNIDESGDFYVDQTLKRIDGGVAEKANQTTGEEFPTPMSSVYAESFLRFNIEATLRNWLPKPCLLAMADIMNSMTK